LIEQDVKNPHSINVGITGAAGVEQIRIGATGFLKGVGLDQELANRAGGEWPKFVSRAVESGDALTLQSMRDGLKRLGS
jgi:hypothetical protein